MVAQQIGFWDRVKMAWRILIDGAFASEVIEALKELEAARAETLPYAVDERRPRGEVGCGGAFERVAEAVEAGREPGHRASIEFVKRLRSAASPRWTRTRAAAGVVSSRAATPS